MDAKHIGSQYVNQGKCVVQPDAGQVSATIAARFGVSRNNYEECVVQPVASTLGNRGVRHTELDGHGAYIPQPVAIQGNLIGRDVGGPHGVGASDDGVMYTLTKADVHGVTQPVPYDLFQITAPVNRQNRKPGDPCHTLARDNAAHAAVAFPIDGRNAMRDADKHDEMNRQGMGVGDTGDPSHTVKSACVHAVAFTQHGVVAGSLTARHDSSPCADRGQNMVACPTLTAHNDPSRSPQSSEVTQQVAAVHATTMTVRRLTPRECERLQGFPDDYTLIPWRKKTADECPDGPRYKALGNSMAVNCMEWIGERIVRYESR